MITVKKAAVLGAGTMGAQIAAHLANAGIPTLLLDIVPRDDDGDRNRIARAGFEAAKKSKPAAFFTADLAALVSIGNFEDDLAKLKACELIIEAVVENLAIKRQLYEKVEQHRRPGAVIASNTSGIPLKQLAKGRSEDFRAHFLGMHFFNPPRYMHLVELIRTEWTKPEVSCSMFGFLDERLGKGVVIARDRPNFIANRIGTFGALVTIRAMLDDGYSIEEVDKINGPAAGRPKTATFRTFDLVGLDVFAHVVRNLHENLPDDPEREMFVMPGLITKMIERGLLGNKTRAGFYKREKGTDGKRESLTLDPATVQKMLDSGAKSFYKQENGQRFYFDFPSAKYVPASDPPGTIVLKSLKDRTGVIRKNSGASLIDLGDGVAGLEFHSKMNSIGGDTLEMLKIALNEVEKNFVGLVVGNQGQNFSVGANLMLMLMEAQDENWEELEMIGRFFQQSVMSLRYSPKPVVVAPFQMVFGGGCEIVLHADRVRANAETYIGLVEVGVGIIPAGCGTKEMLVRALDSIPKDMKDADPFPFVKRAFETIALAKVATSAEEARGYGFLSEDDSVSMNRDRLIADAKKEVLALAASGYVQPQQRTNILALGNPALATLKLGVHMMKRAGYISDHDALIGEKLARILTGGDLNHATRVSEQYLLDLEREAFLSLIGTRKTQERIAHMLKTGKPLRN